MGSFEAWVKGVFLQRVFILYTEKIGLWRFMGGEARELLALCSVLLFYEGEKI